MPFKYCRHILTSGDQCQAPALKGMPYCYFHQRLHRSISHRKSSPDAPLELPPLETLSAVQLALSEVIGALAAGRLDPARASRLLYGLQIASQCVPRNAGQVPADPVHSIELTEEGDELGPAFIHCDCKDSTNCPFRDECSAWLSKARPAPKVNPAQEEDKEDAA